MYGPTLQLVMLCVLIVGVNCTGKDGQPGAHDDMIQGKSARLFAAAQTIYIYIYIYICIYTCIDTSNLTVGHLNVRLSVVPFRIKYRLL